jgi:phosphatidylserine/phosphatidylglycerophosphate/cardiolipin synthase-like enzyme
VTPAQPITQPDINRMAKMALELPNPDLRTLALAASTGAVAVAAFRSGAASGSVRRACDLLTEMGGRSSFEALGGMLSGILVARERLDRPVDVVWTGPAPSRSHPRLTSATVEDLVDRAQQSILLIGYAIYDEAGVVGALERAATRNVAIDLLLERTADNPRYAGPRDPPFATMPARRWCWPREQREHGAALHAKVIVIDHHLVMVGSANITRNAMTKNLECGLLIDQPRVAAEIHHHLDSLVADGLVRRILAY